ncbi:MAG: transposase, partial [SAR202 cluster bacterium]|nr:transposase [SAR202 cluster bacterium]
IGDGALGFWAAVRKVWLSTREQRCWVHKTANVLNKMPKHIQPKAKAMLHEIWMAEGRSEAEGAFGLFVETFRAKYPKATECLTKDREVLLRFYDFPAEHWIHIRTTNPIESTFATVRLRTNKTKGCGSRMACLTMVFKLAQCAERHWRRLNGSTLLADVIHGVRFVDGVRNDSKDAAA